jgi:hypothetical protein
VKLLGKKNNKLQKKLTSLEELVGDLKKNELVSQSCAEMLESSAGVDFKLFF